MKDQQGMNEDEIRPTIQVTKLPMLLRPKQTCELFGIDLKALHKLETSGRVKAIRIGPKKVHRRYSPVAVAKALGVDLMAENYSLVAGMDFTRELESKISESNETVLAKTQQLIQNELQGLRQSVGEIVRSEINNALQNTLVRKRPEPRQQDHRIQGHVQPPVSTGY